ncbi:MAG: RNB domain-containing ribonuclease [Deltaproteobacteria bacterium]|jgi:exoribonuclease-2|nr:RNB domain-containing ribonuclease [Deltaproteobacteria bacterium]
MTERPVVEFLESGEPTLAWSLEPPAAPGKSFLALTLNGQLRLSPGRILVAAQVTDPEEKTLRLNVLKEIGQRRDLLAKTIDLEEVWAILEGEGLEFSFETLAGLAFGHDPGPDELSAIRRAILSDGIFFAFGPLAAKRHTEEEAAQKRRVKAKKKSHEEFVAQGGQWLKESVEKRVAYEPQGAATAKELLINFAVKEDGANDPRTAKELLKAAALPETPEGAYRALVAIGEFSPHENLDIRRLGLGQPFTEAEMAEAKRVMSEYALEPNRLDLTSLPLITIDSEGAKEFDDGLSLKIDSNGTYHLGLHIADVSAIVKPDSLLDEAARSRAASVYLPDGRYPMLPEVLTETLLSLKIGEIRPAFSLLVELDPLGEPLKYDFKPSLIQVKRQMSFDEADVLLAKGDDAELESLRRLGEILLRRRLDYGGSNLALPQLKVHLEPDGAIVLGVTAWDTPARIMVGEMMVLANHLAAETLAREKLACPFRYQEKPRSYPTMDRGQDQPKADLALALATRRQIGRGGVDLFPSPHWGLGLASYTQFTSPIRRYADLLVARQLRTLADPSLSPYTVQEMTTLAFAADELYRDIRKAQNARIRYFLNLWLATRVGQEFIGLIFERRDQRTRVCLTDFMLELDFFKLPPEARPGKEARFKLLAADPKAVNPRFEYLGLL